MTTNTNKKDAKEFVKQSSRNVIQTTKKSFNLIKSKTDITLSVEYWTLKQKQQAPKLTWKIRQCKAYNPTLKKCNLFSNENLVVIDNPDKNLIKKEQKYSLNVTNETSLS